MGVFDAANGLDARVFSGSLRQANEDAETYLRRVAASRRPLWSSIILYRQAGDVRDALSEHFRNR